MQYAKNLVFYSVITVFCFGIFSPVQVDAAEPVPSNFPIALPHALPYDDGTTVWTKYFLIAPSFGNSSLWYLFYTNNGSGDIRLTSTYPNALLFTDYNYHQFYAGPNNPTAGQWTDVGVGDTYFSGNLPDGWGFDSYFGGANDCKQRIFSSHTIFAVGSFSGAAYCTDIVPYDVGDVIFNRVNLEADNQTFQTTTTDPAPGTIVNPDTSEYVDVPDPITDPKGFVVALLTNLGIWLYNLVIPSDDYFTTQFDALKLSFETAFPWAIQLSTAFDNFVSALIDSTPSPVTLNGLNVGGNVGNYTVFDPNNLPDMTSVKLFLSVMMYVGTGWWLVRRTNSLFRA